MKNMLYALLIPVLIYALLVGVLFVYQRKLMYHPDTAIGAPSSYGLLGFSERIVPYDTYSVQLWYHAAQNDMPTIIYFHGNAGNIAGRAGHFDAFVRAGFGVLAMSHPGFGRSTGETSEKNIYAAARATLEYAEKTLLIPEGRQVFFGESLGSGVAVQMATEHTPKAVVLEAPYTSVVNRAAEIYWFVPVKFLLLDRFNSLAKIARVKSPLLIFHGERDQVIPIAHAKALYNAANQPKKAIFFKEVAHNDFDSSLLAKHMLELVQK